MQLRGLTAKFPIFRLNNRPQLACLNRKGFTWRTTSINYNTFNVGSNGLNTGNWSHSPVGYQMNYWRGRESSTCQEVVLNQQIWEAVKFSSSLWVSYVIIWGGDAPHKNKWGAKSDTSGLEYGQKWYFESKTYWNYEIMATTIFGVRYLRNWYFLVL